jgi:hypothetical protein
MSLVVDIILASFRTIRFGHIPRTTIALGGQLGGRKAEASRTFAEHRETNYSWEATGWRDVETARNNAKPIKYYLHRGGRRFDPVTAHHFKRAVSAWNAESFTNKKKAPAGQRAPFLI